MKEFIQGLPKVELHLHIEGTLEPELMFTLAKRNQIDIPFENAAQVHAAYQFSDLQSFLDIYYQGANVLIHEQDFYDLTWAYMVRCQQDNVLHTEIFFDPQTHTARGIAFETVISGISRALEDAKEKFGISSQIIMCFLRHLDQAAAFETLAQALPFKEKIIAIGLDSSEKGHPPEKFAQVFQAAIAQGFLTVAHAGEEGPSENINNALTLLGISRIDHGVRCVDDPNLVSKLIAERTPLTVCPLSNIKLNVFADMEKHNIIDLLHQGMCVTINSDDPAYFGGYMTANFLAVAQAHTVSKQDLAQLSFNAIEASFITDAEKLTLNDAVKHYLQHTQAC